MVDDEQDKNEKIQGGLGRKHKRVDFFRQVKVTLDDDSSMDVFASNVSKGGMFVRSNQPLPAGQKVSLAFETDQGQVEVEECEVRWSKEFEPISIDGTTPGMGIEFKKITPDSKNKIAAFIDEILQEEKSDLNETEAISNVQGQTLSNTHADQSPSPFDKLPESKPIVVTDIEPEPIRAPIRQTDPTTDSEITNAKAAFLSDGRANTGPAQSISKEPFPTPSRIQLQLSDSQDNYLSAPPKPTTRLYLFVGFVVLVAAGTFSIMMWLKPSIPGPKNSSKELDQSDSLKPSASQDLPEVAASQPENQQEQPNQPEPNQAPRDPAQPDQTQTEQKKPDQTQPESAQPNQTQPVSPESVKRKVAQSTSLEPTKSQVAPAVATKTKSNQSTSNGTSANTANTPITLNTPRFRKTSKGWQVTVKASKPLRIRYFTLTNPARLVIDAQQAGYRGKQRLESPIPFIHKIRFGTKPDSTRIVLDFSGKKVPHHKVEHTKDTICITFEN